MPLHDSNELKKRFPSPRLISVDELPEVMKLFESVRERLAERGLDLWQHGYPDEALLKSDIERGTMWGVGPTEDLMAVVTLDHVASPQYNEVKWGWESKHPLIIHRLGVERSKQSMGYGSYLLAFCEDFAVRKGCDAIRLDTYTDNRRNMRFYLGRGYRQVEGEMRFPPHIHAFAGFEKRPGA